MASVTDLVLPGDLGGGPATAPRPMMVVEDAHVSYRVYASGKRINARDGLFSLAALRGGRGLKTVPALRGVSFTASEGETIGVIGHNGSGKSTLFRAMSGLIPTSQGEIWARDRPVLLGVNAALVPELSGENNIKLGLLAMGFSAAEAAAHVEEIADFAELNEFIHHPMRTYSSGMGARLRFAIASAKAHSILLVDEALAVGDRRFKLKSEQRIRELRDTAGLVMIVSHSINSLKDTCDRVLWIHKGELRADGPAADVIADYVKWTKQPGSAAVGAAAAPAQTQPSPPKPAPSSTQAAAAVGSMDDVDPGIAAFEQLLAEAARSSDRAAQAAAQRQSARDAARRERYRRSVREKNRRRIIALAITGGAIILAIGAGAAIAFLNGVPRAPEPAPTVRTSTGAVPTSDPAGPVTIQQFTATSTSVACAATEGEAQVAVGWSVDGAAMVAIASAAAQVDALDAPLYAGLPDETTSYALPFPCTEEARVFTLTVEGEDGTRVSSAVTVTRELADEAEPDQPQRQQSVVPVAPSTQAPVAPTEPAQPEPTTPTEPEPTTPTEPEPTTPTEPEPTTPTEPEPTTPTDPGTTDPEAETPSG